MQTFCYSVAFKRHIEKQHKNINEYDRGNDSDNGFDNDADNNNFDNMDNNPPARCMQPLDVNHVFNKEVTELPATIAKMKASSSVVQSTIDNVVCESSDLFCILLCL